MTEVYRTLDQVECTNLSRYSDEELKQELLKREMVIVKETMI